ncbi:alpha/beta hydrolase [Corynebacterium sp. 13CS0277]|uniref:alpha/beta hydrolase n=1 Tax=Corynebacterium sp. 13CS0277 TaxID=2071994 RepID=UPI001304AD83|nr:alpha/beta hydrolase [Corynebacterium sp. 13CS0277]
MNAAEFTAAATLLHRAPLPAPAAALVGEGAWVDAAHAEQRRIRRAEANLDELYAQARHILQAAADTWEDLRRWAEQIPDLRGPIGRFLTDSAAELDQHCAFALDELSALAAGLCPLPVTPPRIELADLDGIPTAHVDAIHRAHLADAQLHPGFEEVLRRPGQVLSASENTLVLALGDIETAPAVITLVSGVGSSDPASWAATYDRAAALRARTGAAVVCWWGYDTPPRVVGGINPQPARRAAGDLRAFQDSLRGRAQRLIVLGHSYGSVVAGAAATGGLAADALVVAGSPGTTAGNVSEFHLDRAGAPVVVALGEEDPIAWTAELHNTSPASDAFGARVVRTAGGHSDYFTDEAFLGVLDGLVRGD